MFAGANYYGMKCGSQIDVTKQFKLQRGLFAGVVRNDTHKLPITWCF